MTASFRTAWQQADLTSQPTFEIWNMQYLWSIADGAIIKCGAGTWEGQSGAQWDPEGGTLQNLLGSVTDA